jgi:hypothetical protein
MSLKTARAWTRRPTFLARAVGRLGAGLEGLANQAMDRR